MHFVHNKPEVLRRTNAEDIKIVWECIRNSKIQKQNATIEKLIKSVSKETNLNEDSSKRLILNVEADGLIERISSQSVKNSNYNGSFTSTDYFIQPDFSKPLKKCDKDWYCFICHLAGEVISCYDCFRSFHINCYRDLHQNKQISRQHFNHRFNKNNDKFLCYICENKRDSQEEFSRKQIRKLLDFGTHFIRKKSSWKDMLSIGFRNEIMKNEYLVFRYCDLDLIQSKIRDGRYNYLNELVDDAENFVHDVCILHGIYSDKADQARVLLREIKDEINEVQLCADCYINAKAKLAEWITKPCQPNHKLIWAKQSGQYFWPAKLLLEKVEGFEVRFFGGNHDRSFVKKQDTKSFQLRPEEVEVKHGSAFDRAWNEVKKLREKIEQGYYTHSSGESDLPDTEDDYSDEIYLAERRSKGLYILDHNNLANGSNYSLLSSLSSRRSSALEKKIPGSRTGVTVNGKMPLSGRGDNTGTGQHRSKISTSAGSGTGTGTGAGASRNKTKRRRVSKGGPAAKRIMSGDKSVSSYRSTGGSVGTGGQQHHQHGTKGSDSESDSSSDNTDNESDNSSSSVNMKCLNYKFSPKSSILRSPGVSAKSLRQNRKPSAKLSQLSASRYTSLSDRIKMDLSSTESSDFDPKDEKILTRKRARKRTYKSLEDQTTKPTPYNISKYKRRSLPRIKGSARQKRKQRNKQSEVGCGNAVVKDDNSSSSSVGEDGLDDSSDEDVEEELSKKENIVVVPPITNVTVLTAQQRKGRQQPKQQQPPPPQQPPQHQQSYLQRNKIGPTIKVIARSVGSDDHGSSNENTDRCCSPDNHEQQQQQQHRAVVKAPPIYQQQPSRMTAVTTNPSNTNNAPLTTASTSTTRKGGVAPADSTSGLGGGGGASLGGGNTVVGTQTGAPIINVSTTSPYPNRQRINSGYNQMLLNQPPKRMVHKCVATTMPVCNCQEKFDKKMEEEKLKWQREHQLAITEFEKKLKQEFEEKKVLEIKKVSEEIKTQMQELIDTEKSAAQEALVLAEAKHNEALTNTKRRQWCRNCLKEAIYHCCWNTSYCSIQCQQEHWQREHKRVCRRKR